MGGQGLPAITVPAGFTTEVYDLTRDPSAPLTPESAWDSRGRYRRMPGDDRTRLIGPIPARLPVVIDFAGLPFSEPTLLKIAAAYEAGTVLAIACLDGIADIDGSEGVWADMKLPRFDRSEPLRGQAMASFELRPCASDVPAEWITTVVTA